MESCDVFISHADKDKESYVNELKESIESLGIKVFYDKNSIEWGNNWKERIYEGLDSCKYAIVIISKNFYDREWTNEELYTLLSRQNESGEEIILPILYNTTYDEVREHYGSLADIQFIDASKCNVEQITIKLAKKLLNSNSKSSDTKENNSKKVDLILKNTYNALLNTPSSKHLEHDSSIMLDDILMSSNHLDKFNEIQKLSISNLSKEDKKDLDIIIEFISSLLTIESGNTRYVEWDVKNNAAKRMTELRQELLKIFTKRNYLKGIK